MTKEMVVCPHCNKSIEYAIRWYRAYSGYKVFPHQLEEGKEGEMVRSDVTEEAVEGLECSECGSTLPDGLLE